MQVGFFFWPFTPELTRAMADAAERLGWDMVGVADTPGNAMDPWMAATMVAERTTRPDVAICVTNLTTRHPAVTAAAVASLDVISSGRAVLGVGAGHSGTKNLGVASASATALAEGVTFMKRLLTGEPAEYRGARAHLPWVKRAPKVLQAASLPRSLAAAGAAADGVFVNYGLDATSLAASASHIARGAASAGRTADALEVWQIACLDCHDDRDVARRKLGAILAFVSSYVIGSGDLAARGVPADKIAPLLELRRRYSTRPGDADARLVDELGLFDYLGGRLAIRGHPGRLPAPGARREGCGREAVHVHGEPRRRSAARGGAVRRQGPARTSLVARVPVGKLFHTLARSGRDAKHGST
ncbi:MAG TPA: LLM class flavin-dependent oxidoreductase [Terriglobales bacterium]|nr:LLM class flavin-dependent oxidoreductase [Terriglobales bacterium]